MASAPTLDTIRQDVADRLNVIEPQIAGLLDEVERLKASGLALGLQRHDGRVVVPGEPDRLQIEPPKPEKPRKRVERKAKPRAQRKRTASAGGASTPPPRTPPTPDGPPSAGPARRRRPRENEAALLEALDDKFGGGPIELRVVAESAGIERSTAANTADRLHARGEIVHERPGARKPTIVQRIHREAPDPVMPPRAETRERHDFKEPSGAPAGGSVSGRSAGLNGAPTEPIAIPDRIVAHLREHGPASARVIADKLRIPLPDALANLSDMEGERVDRIRGGFWGAVSEAAA